MFTDKNYFATLISGNCIFKIPGLNPQEFPEFPELKEAETIVIEPQKFLKMINLVSYAVSFEQANYILNGILIELDKNYIKLIATDGRRLALSQEKLPPQFFFKEKISLIVPIKTIREVSRILQEAESLKISITEKQVLFDTQDTQISSRLLEGKFPDYNQVLPPQAPYKLKIKRIHFLEALKRSLLLSTIDYQAVELELTPKKLILKKQTPDVGEMKEEVVAEFNGKQMKMGFNPNYLVDMLKNISEEEVEVEISEPEKPAVVRLDYFLYIVLPIRIV